MKKLMIATVTLMAGTAVLAQTPATPVTPSAPMAHPMQDKVMTRAETVQMVRDHFARMDADRNGAITTSEIEQMHSKMAGDMKMRHFEHRLDGAHGDPAAAFDRLDANKDGSISRDEFTKAREERIERRVERREKAQDGSPKAGKEMRHFVMRHHGGMGGRMIVMADTNKDGQITLVEAETMALQHFDTMDANRDGQVTREERRAARPLLMERKADEKKSGT